MTCEQIDPAPPRKSAGPAPARVSGSIRRTSSIGVTWLDDWTGPMRFNGRARDILSTRSGSEPEALAEDSFEATIRPDNTIEVLTASPSRRGIEQLIGARVGPGFRRLLKKRLSEIEGGSAPLALLLDDLAGVPLVASVAWAEEEPDWVARMFGDIPLEKLLKARENVCFAHATGSSAQDPERTNTDYGEAIAAPLERTDDPQGWHTMETQELPGFRRVRRMDITIDEFVVVEAEFQDSVVRKDGRRGAIHEYGLEMVAERDTLAIVAVTADPRVLPYPECPAARANLGRLEGVVLGDLRQAVPDRLAGPAGCTHLNDAMRAIADVPALLHHLR